MKTKSTSRVPSETLGSHQRPRGPSGVQTGLDSHWPSPGMAPVVSTTAPLLSAIVIVSSVPILNPNVAFLHRTSFSPDTREEPTGKV